MRRFLVVAVLVLGTVWTDASIAAGAWQTFQNPGAFTDLIATDDDLWCASREGGLLRFDRVSRRFETFHREPGNLGSNRLTALAFDRQGRLWVATGGAGVSRLSADRSDWGLVNSFDGLPSDTVQALEAQGDTLWIATSQGIALWNGDEISGSLPDPNSVTFDTTFASSSITGVVVLGDEVWLSSRAGVGVAHLSTGLTDWRERNLGIFVLDIQNLASNGQQVFAHSGGVVYVWRDATAQWDLFGGFGNVHNLIDDHGEVLAGTDFGVYRWNGAGFAPVPGAPVPTAGEIPEPTVDPVGVHFVGINEVLYEQRPSPDPWLPLATTFPIANDFVNVVSDGQRVYASTRDRGISRWDGIRWRNWPANPPGPVSDTSFANPTFSYCLFLDASGRKWAGCHETALEEIDDRSEPPQFIHHHLTGPDGDRHTRAIVGCDDGNGGVWFGMFTSFPDTPNLEAAGIDFYDRNGNFANYNFGRRTHGLAYHAARNQMWAGYIGRGVEIFQPPDLATDPIPTFEVLANTLTLDVHSIVIHGDSAWVLTTAGLRRYSAGSRILRQTLSLPAQLSTPLDPYVMDVSPDGSLWLGTQAGVRLYPNRPGGAAPQDFTAANSPLAGNNVRALRVERGSGAVWIATTEGLSRFDPGFVAPTPELPKLEVTIYPNPATITGAGIQLRLAGNSSGYRGEVYDLSGRRIRRFQVPTNGRVFWDGRDEDGRLVQPGIYFVRALAAGREAVARIALLR